MKINKLNIKGPMLALVTAMSLIGCGSSDDEVVLDLGDDSVEASDCFWVGPYTIDNDETNFAFPDTGAAYWHAGYTLPEGASLKLTGEFPHARYMSFNSYDTEASPSHSVSDNEIVANEGSINPFVQGASRNSEFRDYELSLLQGTALDTVPENTLYDAAETGESAMLLYRVYVPDEGKDSAGGVDLPQVELTLASGEVMNGDDACEVLDSDSEYVEIPVIPTQTYTYFRQGNPAQNNLIEEGDTQVVQWNAAYNTEYSLYCQFLNSCEENPEREVSYYANLDNQYVSAFIDNSIKPIVVIRGKIPEVPVTLDGADTFDESEAELRYWSICQNEFYSQKVTDCLYDEQITIQPDGEYLIVTSTLDNKPSNATSECGNEFLEWSKDGDGFALADGMENNENDGLLIVRNMLPTNNFEQSAQFTQTPGDEEEVMGEYLPTAQYFTKEEFEALGCDAYTSL